MPRRRERLSVDPDAVFINVPYDREYEPLFLALISGLSGLGLIPKAVIEIPGSERRLNRILGLIRRCGHSFHDLSRVELDAKRPQTPRFNMPFELGLAVATASDITPGHRWYVLERRRHRLSKSLSDLDGTHVYVHGGTATGVLKQLTNALARNRNEPTVGELRAMHRELVKAAKELKKTHVAADFYDTRPFRDLVYAASQIAKRRITSVRKYS